MVTTRGYRLQDPTPSILLVDGNPDHAELTRVALRRASRSNRVIHCHDGDEALRFIDDIDREPMAFDLPALILLDLSMPRIDGHEVLRTLKQHPRLRRVPVCVLTTSENQKDIERCYEAGANCYVSKPLDFEGYMEKIHEMSGFWLDVSQRPSITDRG